MTIISQFLKQNVILKSEFDQQILWSSAGYFTHNYFLNEEDVVKFTFSLIINKNVKGTVIQNKCKIKAKDYKLKRAQVLLAVKM